jgi:predicted nucleic acid-binding protein
MSNPRKVYWDTSCFICFLNRDEAARSLICDDILRHADTGDIEIWISSWVIVEVIRPRRPGKEPLPAWANAAIKAIPECKLELEQLWKRHQVGTPTKKLTTEQVAKIQGMFQWPFIKKMWVDEIIAQKAVELARDYGLKPGDAIHAASAILKKCEAIQAWDKDFSAVKDLVLAEEPKRMSTQLPLVPENAYGPNAEEFEEPEIKVVLTPEKTEEIKRQPATAPATGPISKPVISPESPQK